MAKAAEVNVILQGHSRKAQRRNPSLRFLIFDRTVRENNRSGLLPPFTLVAWKCLLSLLAGDLDSRLPDGGKDPRRQSAA